MKMKWMMNKKTLVIIYNHNLPNLTNQLYESLKPYESNIYDLFVIDNGSSDEGKSKYTSFETGKNCYFGGGLNLALQYFNDNKDVYDSLLSLNNDLIIHGPNYVKELRRLMEEGDYTILSSCALQPEKTQCHWKYMHNWGSNKVRDVKWVDYQAPLIHERYINKYPQFPSELIYGWGQDILSGIYCDENNWKIGVVDWLPIIHFSALTYRDEKSDITVSEYASNAESNMARCFEDLGVREKVVKFRQLSENYSYENI